MNDVDLMKCMDLAAHLGQLLGMNPVWKKECVIYGGNLDELNLPQEAIALMAEMSKLVKGEEE